MTEHLDDAKKHKSDSHIYKHWTNQHDGRETTFTFEIVQFFSTPLDRQVGEAVRIVKTGAGQILNSKTMYNRSSLPRIVAQDRKEPMNLGDMVGQEEVYERPEKEPEEKLTKKQLRLEAYKDKLNWGSRLIDEGVPEEEVDCE